MFDCPLTENPIEGIDARVDEDLSDVLPPRRTDRVIKMYHNYKSLRGLRKPWSRLYCNEKEMAFDNQSDDEEKPTDLIPLMPNDNGQLCNDPEDDAALKMYCTHKSMMKYIKALPPRLIVGDNVNFDSLEYEHKLPDLLPFVYNENGPTCEDLSDDDDSLPPLLDDSSEVTLIFLPTCKVLHVDMALVSSTRRHSKVCVFSGLSTSIFIVDHGYLLSLSDLVVKVICTKDLMMNDTEYSRETRCYTEMYFDFIVQELYNLNSIPGSKVLFTFLDGNRPKNTDINLY